MDFQNMKTKLLLHVQQILGTRPTVVKFVLLIQLCAFLLALVYPISNLLVLVPSQLFQLHLWRVVTNLFVENNLIVIVWSNYCFCQFLLHIQPNWPLEEIVKYTIIVQLGSTLFTVVSTLLLYIFTGIVYPFYYAQLYGPAALAMAALLALKQYIPDTVFLTTPLGRVKNSNLPLASILLAIPLWLIGLLRGTCPFQLIFSAQLGWTYLRFFQSRGGIGESMIGDRSEHFSWASLFPRRMQPAATLLGRLTFRTLHRLGILKRVMHRESLDYMEEHALQMEALESIKVEDAGAAVMAPESWDAERKRQKALRMLNERLANANLLQQQSSSLPRPAASSQMLPAGNVAGTQQQQNRQNADEPYTMPHFVPPPTTTTTAAAVDRQAISPDVQFYLDQQRSSSEEKSSSQEAPEPTTTTTALGP